MRWTTWCVRRTIAVKSNRREFACFAVFIFLSLRRQFHMNNSFLRSKMRCTITLMPTHEKCDEVSRCEWNRKKNENSLLLMMNARDHTRERERERARDANIRDEWRRKVTQQIECIALSLLLFYCRQCFVDKTFRLFLFAWHFSIELRFLFPVCERSFVAVMFPFQFACVFFLQF